MFKIRLKPVSNQADFLSNVQITDRNTGELLDLTGGSVPLTWSFEAWLQGFRWTRPALTGSTTSGELTIAALGILSIYFPASVMETLQPGSYRLHLFVTDGQRTRQIYLGLLPVIGLESWMQPNYGYGGFVG